MVVGFLMPSCASTLGGLAHRAAWLLATRVLKGLGPCGSRCLPPPGLVRRLDPHERSNGMLGSLGSIYATRCVASLAGGSVDHASARTRLGWRMWWWFFCVLAVIPALPLAWKVPPDTQLQLVSARPQQSAQNSQTTKLLSLTLRSPAGQSVGHWFVGDGCRRLAGF